MPELQIDESLLPTTESLAQAEADAKSESKTCAKCGKPVYSAERVAVLSLTGELWEHSFHPLKK